MGFPGSSNHKESACNAGDLGLIPGSGRSPGEGNGYPLQYACLENPMDRGSVNSWENNFRKGMEWKVLEMEPISVMKSFQAKMTRNP